LEVAEATEEDSDSAAAVTAAVEESEAETVEAEA
jgi:hypothetical protein